VPAETVRPSVCAVGLGWRVLVGESVSEVDLEGSEGVGPAVGALPGGLGALDGEVDEFGGGALVGEVPAGLDALADLAVEVLDAVGIPYEMARCRLWPPTASAPVASGLVSTVRPSGTGASRSKRGRAGRSCSMGFEPVLVGGRPCDLPGCAASANP
jgi:hypothetical protein